MMSVLSSNPHSWSLVVQDNLFKGKCCKGLCFSFSSPCFPSGGSLFAQGPHLCVNNSYCGRARRSTSIFSSTLDDGTDPGDSEDKNHEEGSSRKENGGVNNEFRADLEKMIGTDDSTFSGIDLATLIRSKYGRSYDVQLIKKEFMGRNLLALNVMWKYMEQRSFPLTEEEYLLRLDDVANTLKCWGAVSHIRSSLAKLKERPRIGKAVSIFIDMDESGGRANEWIYK